MTWEILFMLLVVQIQQPILQQQVRTLKVLQSLRTNMKYLIIRTKNCIKKIPKKIEKKDKF